MEFDVVKNDITNLEVDAIVLPANEKLKEGPGTSGAIFNKAGREALTQACREIGTCKVGDAVPTLAFNLNANYIIHAVVPKWLDGDHQEYEFLSAAYLSALNVADILECETIAFPLLSSGNNGFNLELAYDIAKSSINSFEGINIKKVVLVIYSDNVETFLKGKGVTIVSDQYISENDKAKEERKRKLKQFKEGAGRIARKILEEQMAKAFEYLEDEENREKVIHAGITIATMVFARVKKTK